MSRPTRNCTATCSPRSRPKSWRTPPSRPRPDHSSSRRPTGSPSTTRSTASRASNRSRSSRGGVTSNHPDSVLESLFETIAYCEERGIELYGGGQFELASGRTAIQTLAALFYPDGPNDVAPREFNDPESSPPYPMSPIRPDRDAVGFEF